MCVLFGGCVGKLSCVVNCCYMCVMLMLCWLYVCSFLLDMR